MKTPARYTASLLGALLMALAGAGRAEPGREYAAQKVELPPVTVWGKLDLPPPESWHYARFDGFEVLANASTAETSRFLRDFRRFRDVLETIRFVSAGTGTDTALILCDRGDKFLDFTPHGRRDATGSISLFLHDREQRAIVIDLQTRQLGRADLATLLPGSSRNEDLAVDHDRQLYREYIRSLFLGQDFPPPPWVIEGVTQIVGDVEFYDRSIFLGRLQSQTVSPVNDRAPEDVTVLPGDWSPLAAGTNSLALIYGGIPPDEPVPVFDNLQFSRALRGRPLLPLAQLFETKADAPEARNPLGNSLWAKQAYAFVHLCLFGRDDTLVQPYVRFVQRLANEPPTEAIFRECFGMGYPEMERRLEDYIRLPYHRYRRLKLAKDSRILGQDVPLRPASPSEVARIKGDAQRLAGRPADALLTLGTAYARGERDPALLAALGLVEFTRGDQARARLFLESAAKLGTDRPSAYLALARLRLDAARLAPAAGDRLADSQLAGVLAPLLKARSLPPALPDTYLTMAEAWNLSSVAPVPANIHVIGEGVMRFPFHSTLAYQTAQLYVKAGDPLAAGEVARMGLRFATDDATCARFIALLSTLPPTGAVTESQPPAKT